MGFLTMAEYLTAAAYQRWYRQYSTNLAVYIKQLDILRVRADSLPSGEKENIEQKIYTIDEQVQEALARDFIVEKPLTSGELFLENCKVIINLLAKTLGYENKFVGIYKAEKDRVQRVHQTFKFKEQMKLVQEKLTSLEFSHKEQDQKRWDVM